MAKKRLIMISGGCRSGKSSFSQQLAEQVGQKILYISTHSPFDSETREQVEDNKKLRPAHWDSMEQYLCIGDTLKEMGSKYDGIIIDCVTSLTRSILNDGWNDPMSKDSILVLENRIVSEVESILHSGYEGTLIIVTNELGLGMFPTTQMGRAFREVAGRLNHRVQLHAHEFYFMISGVPLRLK